jgi:hypothetical protein
MQWRGTCLYDRPRRGGRSVSVSHRKWARRNRLKNWRRKQGLPVEERRTY